MSVRHFSSWAPIAAAACIGLCSCDPRLIVSGQPDYKLADALSGADREADVVAACNLRTDSQASPDLKAPEHCYWVGKDAIDNKFTVYKINLVHAVDNGSAFGDFTVLALNTAGTITPGAAAAKLFSALALGVGGTKTLINQDVLYKQTVAILISEMNSDRTDAAKQASNDLAHNAGTAQMVNDLLAYYEAGTFEHALVSIQTKASTPDTDKPSIPSKG